MSDLQSVTIHGTEIQTHYMTIYEIMSCLNCGADLSGHSQCAGCGRSHGLVEGVIEATGALRGRNRTVAAFYDGPGWRRFRP